MLHQTGDFVRLRWCVLCIGDADRDGSVLPGLLLIGRPVKQTVQLFDSLLGDIQILMSVGICFL